MVAAAPSAITHPLRRPPGPKGHFLLRSEEHTSELQSRLHLVCRLLLEKKKNTCIVRYMSASVWFPPVQSSTLSYVGVLWVGTEFARGDYSGRATEYQSSLHMLLQSMSC